jgi:general secretion pathway protein A
MYKEFLNLSKLPFENVPDPDFFYDSGDFTRVFVNLTDSLRAGRGLMIVTGAIGSGKTTLSQMVMNEFNESLKLIWVAEPPQSGVNILIFIARELGLSPNDEDRIFLLNDIRSALLASDDRCLLILDEAHLMSDEAANTLKALNNLELNSKKLIQMFLLGQDELLEIINRPEMLPFKQRIALLEKIGRMERSEVRDYIRFRLNVAGGGPDIFTDDAIAAIAIGSGGVPRVINSLCDKALYHAVSKNNETADIEDVYDAAQGMIDRKDIFQLMLSRRNRQMNDGEKSSSTLPGEMANTGATHLREALKDETGSSSNGDVRGGPGFLSSPEALMAPPDNISIREGGSDKGRRRLGVPLLHLAFSIIALAASVYYFFES